MFYEVKLDSFPIITQYYTVVRNTVWQIADKDNILIIIEDGQCLINFESKEYTLKKNDVFFIPANHSYERHPCGNTLCTMKYIHFSYSKEFQQTEAKEIIAKLNDVKKIIDYEILRGEVMLSYPDTIYISNHTTISNFEKLLIFLNDINLFSNRRPLLCNLQSSITLCSILTMLSQINIEEISNNLNINKNSVIPSNLKKAIGYIVSHYSEQIKLESLASYCHVSKQQLIRYFKNSFNTTPINYITEYKLAKAKELLYYHQQLTIKEISAELGFENQRYFTRIFKQHFNETPTQYRNRTHNFDESKQLNTLQN